MKKIIVSIIVLLMCIQSSYSFRFIVYGDTRYGKSQAEKDSTGIPIHRKMLSLIAEQKPELILHTGDLWTHYTPEEFLGLLQENPVINDLLNKNKYLVAKGNHDDLAEIRNFKPPIIAPEYNQSTYSMVYGIVMENCFFGTGKHTRIKGLLENLKKQQTLNWKFMFGHGPVYCSAVSHAELEGDSVREAFFDAEDISIYFSAHAHIYSRSHLLFNKQIIETNTEIASDKGTVYVITGGGGAPLYDLGTALEVDAMRLKAFHFTRIDVTDNKLKMAAIDIKGRIFDQISWTKITPTAQKNKSPLNMTISKDISKPSFAGNFLSIPSTIKPTSITLFGIDGRQIASIPAADKSSFDLEKILKGQGMRLIHIIDAAEKSIILPCVGY